MNAKPAERFPLVRIFSTVLKTEGRVALRTRCSLLPQIVERARQEHPYEVPSVVALPIIDGSPDYIGWILEQTDKPA